MSAAQITQGDWSAVPAADGSGSYGITVDGALVVGEFYPDIRNPTERSVEECAANAQCAAAAPALLKAAKAVAFSNGFDAAYPDKLEALRAAIAKAQGSTT